MTGSPVAWKRERCLAMCLNCVSPIGRRALCLAAPGVDLGRVAELAQQPRDGRTAHRMARCAQRRAQGCQRTAWGLGPPPHRIARRLRRHQGLERIEDLGVALLGSRAAPAGCPQAVRRTLRQARLELATATLDGVTVDSRDLPEQVRPARADAHRFERNEPATLPLVQTIRQHVDLLMKRPIGMQLCRTALLASTRVHQRGFHGAASACRPSGSTPPILRQSTQPVLLFPATHLVNWWKAAPPGPSPAAAAG